MTESPESTSKLIVPDVNHEAITTNHVTKVSSIVDSMLHVSKVNHDVDADTDGQETEAIYDADQVAKLIHYADSIDQITEVTHDADAMDWITEVTHDADAMDHETEVTKLTAAEDVKSFYSDGHAVKYDTGVSEEYVETEDVMEAVDHDGTSGKAKSSSYSISTVAMCKALAKKKKRSIRMKKNIVFLFKNFLVFLISHVGLTILVIAYSIGGAVMFMNIESNNEIENRYLVARVRRQHVKELWKATRDLNVLFKKNWTAIADDVFTRFQSSVYTAVSNGWDGVDEATDVAAKWNYPGALLYSVTVITTIGYGHLTPQTQLGRIATMIYALIGIPITLVCISNIGSLMAKAFKIFWQNFACLCQRGKRKRTTELKSGKKKQKKKDDVQVPIVICLLLMFGYIVLGAMLFHFWEKEWTYFESAYFCFITLSTIGFGDFVPGQSNRQWEDTAKRVTSTLYLLFGLALMAMCFELMQDEVKDACLDFMRCVRCCKKKSADNSITEDSEPKEEAV
ncbi:TWiK family of potassium channels protein 18-like [Gigantopelta aegis]|uniref:TWiK family of potassium channels protein 18-like n=1 Tax=Gigantopelta aegis TaxID=1735272 RepID=UPI001B88CDEF|nr:TWiK family of potassium channels protein 18-like [Gigantopelta aegis]